MEGSNCLRRTLPKEGRWYGRRTVDFAAGCAAPGAPCSGFTPGCCPIKRARRVLACRVGSGKGWQYELKIILLFFTVFLVRLLKHNVKLKVFALHRKATESRSVSFYPL
jgi:hypothetical protein